MTNEEVMVVARAFANTVAACDGGPPVTDEEWEKGQKQPDFEQMKMVARECITALDLHRQSQAGRQLDPHDCGLHPCNGICDDLGMEGDCSKCEAVNLEVFAGKDSANG